MSKEAAPYVVSWSVPINADDRSRGFTLADLQEACCRAKAPPVLTTPGSLSVVAWIQALRFGAKYQNLPNSRPKSSVGQKLKKLGV